jgi:beta-glucosidase
VIVVVIAGRPLVMNRQLDEAAASLMAFLPGSEGGAAIGDALFGKINPSGRLSVSWPRASSQLPLAYNEPGKPYDPRYPFGYGLSYTRFDLSGLQVQSGGTMRASVKVRNVGRSAGTDTVLAFVQSSDGARKLAAFKRVSLDAGDGAKVTLSFAAPAPGSYKLVVGDQTRSFAVG